MNAKATAFTVEVMLLAQFLDTRMLRKGFHQTKQRCLVDAADELVGCRRVRFGFHEQRLYQLGYVPLFRLPIGIIPFVHVSISRPICVHMHHSDRIHWPAHRANCIRFGDKCPRYSPHHFGLHRHANRKPTKSTDSSEFHENAGSCLTTDGI